MRKKDIDGTVKSNNQLSHNLFFLRTIRCLVKRNINHPTFF